MGETKLFLVGTGVERFVAKKNSAYAGQKDTIELGVFSDQSTQQTPIGPVKVDYGWVKDSNNREVIIWGSGLRRGGRRTVRKVSVRNDDGRGIQQITTNVTLFVQTDVNRQVFEKNRR